MYNADKKQLVSSLPTATVLTVGLPKIKLLRQANNIDFSQALELFTTHLNTKATRNKCIYLYHLQSMTRQSDRSASVK